MLEVSDDLSVQILVLVQEVDGLYRVQVELAQIVAIRQADLVRLGVVTAPHLVHQIEICLVTLVDLEFPASWRVIKIRTRLIFCPDLQEVKGTFLLVSFTLIGSAF
jgi:hypothetical protein